METFVSYKLLMIYHRSNLYGNCEWGRYIKLDDGINILLSRKCKVNADNEK